MTELNVPEGLPVLSHGSHQSPVEGACFMEYTALLAGLPFSDNPPCVDSGLAVSMAFLNDNLSDENRSVLVPFLGRGIGLVAPGRAFIHDFLPVTLCLSCDLTRVCPEHRRKFGGGKLMTAETKLSEATRLCTERSELLQTLVLGRLYKKYQEVLLDFRAVHRVLDAVERIFSVLQPQQSPRFDDLAGLTEYQRAQGEAAVIVAEDLHRAYEEAMEVLYWKVKREVACPLPEVVAKVGTNA